MPASLLAIATASWQEGTSPLASSLYSLWTRPGGLLSVCNARREDEIDRKLLRQGKGARLIFFHPPLLGHRFERRSRFPLERPQITGGFVDRHFPIEASLLDERSDDGIERPHPPFPSG